MGLALYSGQHISLWQEENFLSLSENQTIFLCITYALWGTLSETVFKGSKERFFSIIFFFKCKINLEE